MTTATPSTALATIQPAFTDAERLALAGLLAGYRSLTREAYALDLRQFTTWCRARSLALFAVRRADIASYPRFAAMGPEPLGPAFDGAHLARAFQGRRQGVKPLLLDQRMVAGLGNIYVCEALHRARISPSKAAGSLSRARLDALAVAIREVLREAITAGGSTLRDFADVAGGAGYFQHDFRVYGRTGEVCPAEGCGGRIRRIVQGGRSTFHCPKCQK